MARHVIAAGIIEVGSTEYTVISTNQVYTPAEKRGDSDPTVDAIKNILEEENKEEGINWVYIGPDVIGPPRSSTFIPKHAEEIIIDYGEDYLPDPVNLTGIAASKNFCKDRCDPRIRNYNPNLAKGYYPVEP